LADSIRRCGVSRASFVFGFVAHPQKFNELALGCEQIRAVDRQEGRAFLDDLARRRDVQFLHVTIDARDELPVATSVRHDHTNRANCVTKRLAFDFRPPDPDLLLPFDWHHELACLRRCGLCAPFHSRHPAHAFHLAAAFCAFTVFHPLRVFHSFRLRRRRACLFIAAAFFMTGTRSIEQMGTYHSGPAT